LPVHIDRGREVARKPDDQAQPILGEPQRQLVERELSLLLDLLQLGENFLFSFHSCSWKLKTLWFYPARAAPVYQARPKLV
jgi:hypothetical protein